MSEMRKFPSFLSGQHRSHEVEGFSGNPAVQAPHGTILPGKLPTS